MRVVLRTSVALFAAIAVVGGVAACSAFVNFPGKPSDPDDWVVVSFDATEQEFPLDVMDAMLPIELAADEALRSRGAGQINGNDIGDHQYELYFVGSDREEMWEILQPFIDSAPVAWTRVELRHGWEDRSPTVLTP